MGAGKRPCPPIHSQNKCSIIHKTVWKLYDCLENLISCILIPNIWVFNTGQAYNKKGTGLASQIRNFNDTPVKFSGHHGTTFKTIHNNKHTKFAFVIFYVQTCTWENLTFFKLNFVFTLQHLIRGYCVVYQRRHPLYYANDFMSISCFV